MFMYMNRIKRSVPLWCTAVLAMTMAACVDKDYDLGDVDKTVGLGNTIQLPSNNYTDDIPLDDLLDLGINDFLSVGEDGMYNISAIDDNEFIAHMGVPRFSVPSKTYKGKYVIDLGDFDPRKSVMKRVKKADDDISFKAPMVDLDFSVSYNSKNIMRLEKIGFSTKLTITLAFAKDLQAALGNISRLSFTLPQCLEVGNATWKNSTIAPDGNNTFELKDVNTAEGVKVVIELLGVDLSEKKADGSYMTYTQGEGLTFHGALNMAVVVKESAIDFDKVAEAKDLSVSGTAVIDKFNVTTAKGGFAPVRTFKNVGGVALRYVPPFLSDDDVNLDLYDPQLNINISSTVPFATKMKGAIVSKDKKGNVLCRIDVPEFSFKSNGESIVSLRRRPATHESDTTVIVLPNICDVIRNIPDSIALIDLEGVGDDRETAEITLSKYYEGKLRLSVASGISLAEEALIVYNEEYSGWNDTFKKIRFVETEKDGQKVIEGFVRVYANVYNKIPGFLTLKPYGIDHNGNPISYDRLSVDVEKIISPSPDGKKVAKTEEVINIRPKDNDVFKILDGIRFRVEMTTKQGNEKVVGVLLNAYKQTVKVTDVKVQKFGKVAYDLN